MFTTEQYLNAVQHEVQVIKHLYTKVPKDKLDYRPTPKQRSLQELLNALPFMLTTSKHLISCDWSTSQQSSKDVQESAQRDFVATIDRELAAFAERVKSVPEKDFQNKEVPLPTGTKTKLGDALLNFTFKFITGYKMQLFLYLKSCGRTELNTFNCWFGIDGEMPKR